MAKMSKAARIAARARNARNKSKNQVGQLALAGSSWFTGGWTGDRMAKDLQKDPSGASGKVKLLGRELPKYETFALGGLAGMILLGPKLAPEINGAVTGALVGVAAGAAAVRKNEYRKANPEAA